MERLKSIKDNLIAAVQCQDISSADAKEMGEVVDMIKDIEEAIYYCTITKAMEEKYPEQPMYYGGRGGRMRGYIPYMDYRPEIYRDMDYDRMYYTESGMAQTPSGRYSGSVSQRTKMEAPVRIYDSREGRSGMTRRNYMEGKEMHHNQDVQMQELKKYMQELSEDITEMIQDASPDEKLLLKQKLTSLTQKLG